MNIEQLARDAGWSGIYGAWTSAEEWRGLTVPVTQEQIERFAALVRAAALEEAAQLPPVAWLSPDGTTMPAAIFADWSAAYPDRAAGWTTLVPAAAIRALAAR